MIILWSAIFIVSLIVLVKGADWLIVSSEKIGLSIGLSPFIVGVTIVGIGTSLPELASSVFAVLEGAVDVPVANAVGSNIANILLIIGFSAVISKRLMVDKDLIDLDLPLVAGSTALFIGMGWDGVITFGESLLLMLGFGVYLLYTILHKDIDIEELSDKKIVKKPKITIKDIVMLIIGILGLILGSKYLIESLISLSSILNIATGVIAITAVAVGTSLPELLVSAKAALQGKSEVALGNIFGSNVFNILIVIGLPGLFKTLTLDTQTLYIGIPTLIVTTLLFVISGISKRIYSWEGLFFLLIYVLFIAKLFNWF
ncbi:MAG: calcium/sodium antiporter [Candidatus Paceibacterota bacterium]|jgi:cation:H+ antiporter